MLNRAAHSSMPIGRPRLPGTESERAQARREQVRANVQAFRRRQREKRAGDQLETCDEESLVPQVHDRKAQDRDSFLRCTEEPSCRSRSSTPNPDIPRTLSMRQNEKRESWLWAIPLEMGVNLGDSFHASTLAAVLQHEYLVADSPSGILASGTDSNITIRCATWTASVSLQGKSQERGVLMDATLAAALAIAGRDREHRAMALHATYVQNRALRRLRRCLTQYEQGESSVDAVFLSLTALTCAMSELATNQSWANFNRHLLGIGALISHGSLDVLKSPAGLENFYGYRAVQTPFLFMNRQSTFLSKSEWIDFPFRRNSNTACDPLQSLVDIALGILPDIVKQDMAMKCNLSLLVERLQRATEVVADLDTWEQRLRKRHQSALYVERPAIWGGLHDLAFEFVVPSSAIAFTMYTALRIHVASFMACVSEEIYSLKHEAGVDPSMAVQQALHWSRIACQCVESFHISSSNSGGRIVSLWPLETAWELFSRLGTEKSMEMSKETAWCRSVAERLSLVGIPPYQWR